MRVEREKSEYKQRMWSKVNNWLADIDGGGAAGNHHSATPATLSTIGGQGEGGH